MVPTGYDNEMGDEAAAAHEESEEAAAPEKKTKRRRRGTKGVPTRKPGNQRQQGS